MDFVPALIVGVIAIIYSAFLFLYQRYVDKKYGIKQKNKKMKELQAIITKNYKTKDAKDPEVIKENSKLQKEMMSISSQIMKLQFKSMIWIMVAGLLVLAAINLYKDAAYPIGGFWIFTQVITWFIVISLVVNILYKIIFSFLEKKKLLE